MADRARKLLVRTALTTSATIATLVGAQSFAMLDADQFTAEETVATVSSDPIMQVAPEITIIRTAPSITILRQAGQTTSSSATNNAPVAAIQPPVPAQITAPQPVMAQPVVVQQPVRQTSRSTR